MLILASASPRRRELLTQAGLDYIVEPADIDETPLPNEAAAAYVQRLAIEKAQAVYKLHASNLEPPLVLAADTCVVLDDRVLGKPTSGADAVRMLTMLSGRTHAVMTGVAAVSALRTVADVEITQVTFNLMTEAEIREYVDGGEPLDKAGAYAIQGYAARWIPRIEGDYGNVVGLPIARVVRLLAEVLAPVETKVATDLIA
ncbi:septum formation inhibitor Maf [Granulicella sp. WH15]|uniref:Maf family protein n=1 Tax=Granulicella sp. WH15 TaxID=2602070 RepID=UPI001366BDB7|nr:Maf family protein [Granulicella sp. WH15]QHN05178.1 septum formation inhibitor Maf [Granulicella sp. WH15]